MAASGFTPISLYHSTSAAAVPVNTNLVAGELAINITDGKLYYKDNAGVVKLLASNATSTPVTSISFGSTGLTPSTATSGVVSVAGTLAITNGGTGQTTAGTAFNALSPITTTGDLILGNGTNSATRLGIGTNGQVLTSNGTTATWAAGGGSPEIKTPSNVTPANAATNIGQTPVLTGSTYYSLYGIAMAAGQWEVSTVSDFSSTVVSTGDVAGTSVSYTVTGGILVVSTTYYWRVRYKDANGTYSDWSTGTSFTTAASFVPAIGSALGGGFFAGQIDQSGTIYNLIIAPKSSGEDSSKQWKTANTTTAGTTSVIDGPTNSTNMNNASHPAAQFCEGLSIGGFSDWYMPAKNELEVCYYNLKPTTTSNNTSSGTNTNAVPSRGSNYTAGTPAQTSVAAFQSAGAEAFAADDYWSSTENSATNAWEQYFFDGSQSGNGKTSSYYVRAVRRVLA
jgi:hypothetical protein